MNSFQLHRPYELELLFSVSLLKRHKIRYFDKNTSLKIRYNKTKQYHQFTFKIIKS